jgi:hypothetical protein
LTPGVYLLDISITPIPVVPDEDFEPNFAPMFLTDLEQMEVNLLDTDSSSYQLPPLFDININDTYTIEIKNKKEFKYLSVVTETIDESTKTLIIFDKSKM